jgi:hypothetical protein
VSSAYQPSVAASASIASESDILPGANGNRVSLTDAVDRQHHRVDVPGYFSRSCAGWRLLKAADDLGVQQSTVPHRLQLAGTTALRRTKGWDAVLATLATGLVLRSLP